MQGQTFRVASSQNLSVDNFCRSWSHDRQIFHLRMLGIALIFILCNILTPCHPKNDAFDD